jgi:copper chaperone
MNQEHITLKINGMTCMGCVNSVKRLLGSLSGIGLVEVDLASGLANVDYDPALVEPSLMRQTIIDGGYQVES